MSYVRADGYRLKDPEDDAAFQVVVGDLQRLSLAMYKGSPNAAYVETADIEAVFPVPELAVSSFPTFGTVYSDQTLDGVLFSYGGTVNAAWRTQYYTVSNIPYAEIGLGSTYSTAVAMYPGDIKSKVVSSATAYVQSVVNISSGAYADFYSGGSNSSSLLNTSTGASVWNSDGTNTSGLRIHTTNGVELFHRGAFGFASAKATLQLSHASSTGYAVLKAYNGTDTAYLDLNATSSTLYNNGNLIVSASGSSGVVKLNNVGEITTTGTNAGTGYSGDVIINGITLYFSRGILTSKSGSAQTTSFWAATSSGGPVTTNFRNILTT